MTVPVAVEVTVETPEEKRNRLEDEVKRLEGNLAYFRKKRNADQDYNDEAISNVEKALAEAKAELEKSRYPRYYTAPANAKIPWVGAYVRYHCRNKGFYVQRDGREESYDYEPGDNWREITEAEAKALIKPKKEAPPPRTRGQEIAEKHVGHVLVNIFSDHEQIVRDYRQRVAKAIDDALAENERAVKERIKKKLKRDGWLSADLDVVDSIGKGVDEA